MYGLIVYLYFILFIVLILFGRHIGYRGASILSCFVMCVATLLSYLLFFEVALNQSVCSLFLWRWISFDLVQLDCYLFFDVLSVSMLLIISTVSLCAVVYSIEYMSEDPYLIRFISYMSLFVFFMIILVTSSNLFQLFIGWEGVGICSYLLINFWFTRVAANRSALLAVFINKIGDIFVLFSLGIIFAVYKTCDFSVLFGLISFCDNISDYIIIFGYLILIGAVAKSAQLGLHVWLPEAMEGPTPVSSLIHAATMVTAGIFLLVRFSFILEYNYKLLVLCMFFGSLTAFFASSIGIFLYDIKKIIAYSTCSQLGYMLMSCGFSNYSYTMFHLISHAFFKALLFLTAGYIIHFCGNEQDIRRMGGFLKLFPSGYMFLLIGSLSLVGFPFMSGFFSKEMILEGIYSSKIISFYDISILCQFIGCFSLFFSVLYSIRLIIYIFYGQYNGFKYSFSNFHYSGYLILSVLFILSIFSIFFGYVSKEAFIGEGTSFWQNSFFNFSDFNNNDNVSNILYHIINNDELIIHVVDFFLLNSYDVLCVTSNQDDDIESVVYRSLCDVYDERVESIGEVESIGSVESIDSVDISEDIVADVIDELIDPENLDVPYFLKYMDFDDFNRKYINIYVMGFGMIDTMMNVVESTLHDYLLQYTSGRESVNIDYWMEKTSKLCRQANEILKYSYLVCNWTDFYDICKYEIVPYMVANALGFPYVNGRDYNTFAYFGIDEMETIKINVEAIMLNVVIKPDLSVRDIWWIDSSDIKVAELEFDQYMDWWIIVKYYLAALIDDILTMIVRAQEDDPNILSTKEEMFLEAFHDLVYANVKYYGFYMIDWVVQKYRDYLLTGWSSIDLWLNDFYDYLHSSIEDMEKEAELANERFLIELGAPYSIATTTVINKLKYNFEIYVDWDALDVEKVDRLLNYFGINEKFFYYVLYDKMLKKFHNFSCLSHSFIGDIAQVFMYNARSMDDMVGSVILILLERFFNEIFIPFMEDQEVFVKFEKLPVEDTVEYIEFLCFDDIFLIDLQVSNYYKSFEFFYRNAVLSCVDIVLRILLNNVCFIVDDIVEDYNFNKLLMYLKDLDDFNLWFSKMLNLNVNECWDYEDFFYLCGYMYMLLSVMYDLYDFNFVYSYDYDLLHMFDLIKYKDNDDDFDFWLQFLSTINVRFALIFVLVNLLDENIINDFVKFEDVFVLFKPTCYFAEFNSNVSGFIFFSSMYFFVYCLIYGFFLSRVMHIYRLKFSFFFNAIYLLFSKKYVFFNRLFFITSSLFLFIFKLVVGLFTERGLFERFTSYGIVYFVRRLFFKYIHFKTGIIYHYAGFLLFVSFLLFLILC